MTPRASITTIRRVSQFPPPSYQQPPYPQVPYQPAGMDFSQYMPYGAPDLLAWARRAAVLQGILAGLMLACGACIGSIVWAVDLNEAFARANVNPAQFGGSIETLRVAYTVFGVISGLIGLGLFALAYFVNRGGAIAIVISIVLCSIILLFLGLNVVGSVLMSAGAPAAAIMSIVMLAVPIGLFGLNIAWLAAAARNASRVRMAQQQYQAQFYQMQQQQYAYGQQGYGQSPYAQQGYAYPPAGAPQPPAPSAPGDAEDRKA